MRFLHLPELQWIKSSDTAMLAVIIVTVWKSLGYAMIFYLSALEKVPKELYEASGWMEQKGGRDSGMLRFRVFLRLRFSW